jgi:hypothetical protein
MSEEGEGAKMKEWAAVAASGDAAPVLTAIFLQLVIVCHGHDS